MLTSIQRVLRDENILPENVVAVSGIGCSSRLPHYLKTYGFHGIHGRALPISTGISLARPDLNLFTIMGDGDCFSIGGNHWLHTTRYNINAVVLILDNEVYALTKKQASPTTKPGVLTNTTPTGAYLKHMNPVSMMMGMANISFLAQTASWLSLHLEETIRKAFKHKGMSYVRVLQTCPTYLPHGFGDGGQKYPIRFLENKDGIPIDEDDRAIAEVLEHDHSDIHAAQKVAAVEDPTPIGLIYWDPSIPTYTDVRLDRVTKHDRKSRLKRLEKEIDKYTVKRT